MITEDYVSFEMAKLLKEKGFDEPSIGFYTISGDFFGESAYRKNWIPEITASYNAPSLQMVLKWLRGLHNIFISVDLDIFSKMYFATVYNRLDCATPNPRYGTDLFKTPKEACETAIMYCLENLIGKEKSKKFFPL